MVSLVFGPKVCVSTYSPKIGGPPLEFININLKMGGPPLGTISMDLVVIPWFLQTLNFNSKCSSFQSCFCIAIYYPEMSE